MLCTSFGRNSFKALKFMSMMAWLKNASSVMIFIMICMYLVQNVDGVKKLRHNKARVPVRKTKAEVKYIEVTEDEYPMSSRVKRSADDLMKRFLKSYKNPGLTGDVMYIARRDMMLQFNLDENLLSESTPVHSELRLYKKAPKKLPRQNKKSADLPHARVTIQQTITEHRILGDTKVLASVPLNLNETGWSTFDVTKAVQEWTLDLSTNKGLQVWIESSQRGKLAARVARKTRFLKPNYKEKDLRPLLVIYYVPGRKDSQSQ